MDQDPDTGEVTVTPKKPDGTLYPENTKVEIPGKDKDHPITITIGKDGKGKVPNSDLPEGKVSGPGKITEPNKPAVEVPKVETPAKVTPETPVTEKPGKIEITRQPNGNAIVTPKKPDGTTYPSGSKVEIPGENGTPITVTIGDNGSGEVPNDNLPKEAVPGTGTVTEPNKKPSQPVDVTTPARKTPTVDVEQDPKTGDVTVTPKKPDGTTYPPGTKVEIPGKDGNPITVTIGEDGKGKVPNSDLPEGKVSGPGKITEPNKPAVEVPKVETPAKVTPETPVTEKPGKIEITRQPNGNAIVTPKKPDGTTYPSGSKVEIPGEDGTTITVTIGDNGSGEVPNDKLPKGNLPGKGIVTEPNKRPSQPVDVTTPARKTPAVELDQNPNTGDVTVTPKKPDGSTYPPGTIVEIPGKYGNPIRVEIGQNGKGTVPNSELPDGKTSGNAKIAEPNKPVENVTVETPARLTPAIVLDQDPNTGDVTVTPKKPDGTTYPPGTKVEIPGKNGTPIVVTTGPDGKVIIPNKDLPDGEIPGTGKITPPGKPSVEVNVKTPKKLDPNAPQTEQPGEIEITIKPNGDAVVTPKKTDKTTYPEGTIVKIPGENGTSIVVTIGKDGSGTVPNDQLPKEVKSGKGTVTEPGRKPSNPVDVTTPARKTPTVELDQDPNTGDVTVTPKKPDGTLYPENTKVEIPGKNGKPIVVIIGKDGKGTIPNKDLPDGIEPGKGTITEPGKDPVEVIVTTPARKIPTVVLEPNPQTGVVTVTPATNGNSGQDTPAPTSPIPDAVTPNADHEDTTDASDNGAKSNDSQNVLPNTGTESNATLASLGLLGMLGGLGLAFGKKKED